MGKQHRRSGVRLWDCAEVGMRSHLLETVCALVEESSTECFAQTVEEMRT